MKPTRQPKPWKNTKHCQRNPIQHGAYSAQMYSARAYLRALDGLLDRLEAESALDCDKARAMAQGRRRLQGKVLEELRVLKY